MKRRTAVARISMTALPFVGAMGLPRDARADKDIVLAQSAVLSGPLSPAGIGHNQGALLAFSQLNSLGGIGGKSVRLVALDNGYDPAKTVETCKKLLREVAPLAFFGTTGTPTTAAAIPVLREEGVALVGGAGVSDSVRERSSGVGYFVRATYAREIEKVIQHLATLGLRKLGMACIAGPAGDEVSALLRKAVISSGNVVDVVATAMVATDGSNVAAAADQIVRSQPQAVILFLIGAAAIEFIRSLTRAGAFPNYFGMSVVACDAVAKALGSELRGLTSCQIVPYPWSKSDPTARQFQQLCSARDLPVNYYTYEGYLNALFLIDVLQRTGGDVGRQTLHRALRSYRGKVGGMDLDFTGGASTGGHFVELVHVRPDGSFVR